MPRTSWERLRRFHVSLPDIGKQRAIGEFLDRETERIDQLMKQKRRLIELLQEKRIALISDAVTKGLDRTVPMKDSGIQWFGKIPTHWRLERLRRVIRRFVDYRGKTPSKVEDGVLLVTAKNVRHGAIDLLASIEYMRSEDYVSWMVRGFPEVGDVILTTEAPLGQIAQIEDATVALAQRIILLKAAIEIRNEFLAYALRSLACQSEFASRATGSTAVGIKADRLRDVLVPVPPLDEQDWIDGHLAQRSESIGAAEARLEHQLVKLTEYRQAVITAAVTGQIDVSVDTPESKEMP